jgi:energy-coupling factor transport system ATP-binding protein
LEVRPGEIVALMGRNGAGKSTLLKTLVGLVRPAHGRVRVDGADAASADTATLCRTVAYLPQDPNALLFADTVEDELRITLRNHGYPMESPETQVQMQRTLARLRLESKSGAYPRDMSVGERQRVALGAVTVTEPRALLLDEPTRGLDLDAKMQLAETIREWRTAGAAVVLVTHDVEFAALLADRVVLLSQGEVIADGPPAEVLGASPLFAPQVARLFPNTGWLTEEDALRGLGVG